MSGAMKKVWGLFLAPDTWKPITVDANGYLQVDVKSQTEKDRQIYGHDGAAWQKLGLLFGYNDTYGDAFGFGAYMDGSNYLMGETVPAGYIYVVTHMTGMNMTTAPAAIHFGVFNGSQIQLGITFNNPGLNIRVGGLTHMVLKEGYAAVCQIDGCITDDMLMMDIIGYKMKIS